MNQKSCVLTSDEVMTGLDMQLWSSSGGGSGLLKVLCIGSDESLKVIQHSGLLGFGGSGFPVAVKWRDVKERQGEKYLVCNGNEDEIGTYKDRELMLNAPFQLIEGASIAAIICGIEKVIFYVNNEYKNCVDIIKHAIEIWLKSDLYKTICSKKINLSYQLVLSPGQYVAGEETAVVQVIQGKFPFPQGKPPYPSESGLYGKPTLINNIETLCNVPQIFRYGSGWYRSLGTKASFGTKLISLNVDEEYRGCYEISLGTSLKQFLLDHQPGEKFYGALVGGPSGRIVLSDNFDIPLSYDFLGFGSGTVSLFRDLHSLLNAIQVRLDFFARESCGQCSSCRTGIHYLSIEMKLGNWKGEACRKNILAYVDILRDSGRCHLLKGAVEMLESFILLHK